MRKTIFLTAAAMGCYLLSSAQKTKTTDPNEKIKAAAITDLQSQTDTYKNIALQIWGFAETGFKETQSSSLLQKTLKENGFTVEAGVAGMPTAFVASYGSGKPVIGILAEFDALPGLSQDSVPVKTSLNKEAGHACGHHLFGTASVASAIQLKKIIEQNHWGGTIKLFGTPAEEGGSGKVYMVRDGLFKDVDVVMHWHPADANAVSYGTTMAIIGVKFRFHGISSHAAFAPDKGRSALDGVEAMDNMINMMREHIPSDARIHYIITNGGKAPNVVPDFAESFYYVRHYDVTVVKQLFDRVVKAAQGAALGTGTTMDYEIEGGDYSILPNKILSVYMQQNLDKVGGVTYTPEETAFAEKIQASFAYKAPPVSSVTKVMPLSAEPEKGPASSDVGDVSWAVPTVGLVAATWVAGTPPHSWQAVACGGINIGIKGMMIAAKTLTLTGIDLLTNKQLVEDAKAEFIKNKDGVEYQSLIGDRKPALDYRN
ncbi:amidohydrolase [Parafilimonas sp.]|uniref:amidohydrolase n=1 Tax=Parafilimonas sp. TaxID=1969739 RepID=UPI0039E5D09A